MLDFNKTESDHVPECSTAEICRRLNDRIEALAFSLLGPPNDAMSNSEELRYGRQGSLSIKLDSGRWYHHEEKTGGAALELLRWHSNVDEDEALELARQWLGVNIVQFPAKPKQPTAPQTAPQKAPPKFVQAYGYHDESGTLLFQVVRYEPKTFRQRRPDGHGGWIWKVDGVRRVPYRLPELLRAVATGQRIYIAEGEKDCDALAALGLAATCNPGGAGKWDDALSQFFLGADVAILPDNDEPGRKHAIDVANSLDGVAATWRVVQLPDLPEKGDPADWIAAGGAAAALDALVEATPLGQMPATEAPPPDDAPPDAEPAKPQGFHATPFDWPDVRTIPRRQWLYGHHLIRKFLSVTVAPGGIGKSSLAIAEALAMASGKPILGERVRGPLTVWLWNLEDPRDELVRRIMAACQHYGLTREDIGDRLLVDSGREAQLCTAVTTPAGAKVLQPVIDALIQEIFARKIDVLSVDPFVSTHQVGENDNGAIDAVAKAWGRIAEATNSAIELVHHTRKQNGVEVDEEAGRGASALVFAARECRALNRMTAKEGKDAGIENHRLFFRSYSAKANLAPPANKSTWFQLESVDLGNDDDGEPGDSVAVVVPWTWPDVFEGITGQHVLTCQQLVRGKGYRLSDQSEDWVGIHIAEVLGRDPHAPADRSALKQIIAAWLRNGALVETIAVDSHRKPRRAVDVGKLATVDK